MKTVFRRRLKLCEAPEEKYYKELLVDYITERDALLERAAASPDLSSAGRRPRKRHFLVVGA